MDPVDPSTRLMLLADARLPTAGHTQSGGLEPALRAGLTPADVPAYIGVRLSSVVRVEAATAVVTLYRIRNDAPLGPVLDSWNARTPSPALRANAELMGNAQLRLVRALWPDAPGLRAVAELEVVPRAIALGVTGDAAGLPAEALARLVGYDDVQTVAAAALKLAPLDPLTATRWVLDALPVVEALADELAGLTEPSDIPATGAPQVDCWAQDHTQETRRLFRA